MTWLIIILPALLAGFLQGLTGFGAVIMMMVFFPLILPIPAAAGIACVIMIASQVVITWRYRDYFKFTRVFIPFVIYSAVSAAAVVFNDTIDTNLLRKVLGVLLVALAFYFYFCKTQQETTYPWYLVAIFLVVSGFFNGLLGIGGPLMALYFLSISENKADYLGNIQGFFLLNALLLTAIRLNRGILVPAQFPLIAVGLIAAISGTLLATRFSAKWNLEKVSRVVYIFIGVSGIYYLFF